MAPAPLRPTAVVLAATLPYPPRSGLDLRVLATVRALGAAHDVGAMGLSSRGVHPPPNDEIVAWRVSRQFAPDVAEQASLEWLRRPTGHPSDRWYSDGVMSELARLIDDLKAPVVVLETLWLHRYIAPLQELGCVVVLNAHGIEGALHDELAVSRPAALTRKFAERTCAVEAGAFAAADQVWVCSAHDAELARETYDRCAPLKVVPNAIDLDRYSRCAPSSEHFTVAFSASFAYPPNVSASRRLLADIFPPLARRIPRARLALIGRDPSAQMRAAAELDERIEVTGTVDDVAPYLQRASAMAVPLSEGHGTRFKVLEAFASGLPVVSTRKGVEGIEATADEHYLVAESDADFVAALELLARDPELGMRLAQRGLETVRACYSLAVAGERVTEALAGGSQRR